MTFVWKKKSLLWQLEVNRLKAKKTYLFSLKKMPYEWVQLTPKIPGDKIRISFKRNCKSFGQDMLSIWKGCAYADYLTYWNISIWMVLLLCGSQKTSFKTRRFIIYHQRYGAFISNDISEMEANLRLRTPLRSFFIERMERIMIILIID